MTHSKKILCTAIAIASAMSNSAFSQVEEITVSGTLQSNVVNSMSPPLPLLDTPQAVAILSSEEIRSRGFRELGDIVRYTAGVNQSQGEGHRDSVVFRGVRSTADFYRDGLRDDVQYFRSLYNVEQVEVLRGPNALLFGRGGTGGLINRVTKKAMIGQSGGSFDAGSDTFGAFDVAADFNIQTSESSALRINAHRDSLENHRNFYDGQRVGFNPTFRMELGQDTTLDLSYEHANHERFIDRGIPTQNGVPVEGLADVVFGTPDLNVQRLTADILRGSLSREFSNSSRLNVNVQYDSFEKLYQNLYASGFDGDVVTMDGYKDPTTRENLFLDANYVTEFGMGAVDHALSIGAQVVSTDNANHRFNTYWSTTSDDNEKFNISNPMDFTVNSAGQPTSVDYTSDLNNSTMSEIDVTSIYIQDQINIGENLILMLGGRLDQFDITVNDVKAGSSQSRQDDQFSPRAGPIFKPQDSLSLYISYSESFLPRSGEQYKKLSASSARLDPDVFENTEFGVKWDIAPGLMFAAAYFQNDQTQAVRDSVTGEQAEIVGLQVDGFELELKGQLNDSLSVAAGYTSMDGTTSSGGEPRELPESTMHLWANYQVNAQFGLGVGFAYQDEQNIKNNKPGLILPDYTRWDAAAYYNVSDDLEIRLNVENLSDELYFPFSHSTHQASVGKDLNARLSITRRF